MRKYFVHTLFFCNCSVIYSSFVILTFYFLFIGDEKFLWIGALPHFALRKGF